MGEAIEQQQRLRERVRPHPPPAFAPQRIAGADVSIARGSARGHAGVVVIDLPSMVTVDARSVAVDVRFPYVPGLLSFRELPAIAEAWAQLEQRPDVVIFDGAGYAHPRRFGLACHGGVLFDVPSIGCAKSVLVGTHAPLDAARGATAALVHRGEIVGMAVRLRARAKPVYVSIGHLVDLPTAVAIVLSVSAGFREPETTRRAHRLVNEQRRAYRDQ